MKKNSEQTQSSDSSLKVWPEEGLEIVGNCPVCHSNSSKILYKNLKDEIFNCAPGIWEMKKCNHCEGAFLDPRPTENTIHLAYGTYYTHESVPHKNNSTNNQSNNFIKRILKNWISKYEKYKYSTDQRDKKQTFGRLIILFLRPLAHYLDASGRHLKARTKNNSLLDIASGSGDFLVFARKAGWQVEGLEFDPKAVEVSRALGLNVKLGSVDVLSEYTTTYNLITASHILEHVHAPLKLLNNCYSLLKPGGTIWIETPNINALGHRRFLSKWRGLEPPRHLVIFSKKSLRDSLKTLGFRNIRFHNRGLNTVPTYATSQVVEQGFYTPKEQFKNSLSLKYWLDVIRQYFNSNRREFLTVTADKPKNII